MWNSEIPLNLIIALHSRNHSSNSSHYFTLPCLLTSTPRRPPSSLIGPSLRSPRSSLSILPRDLRPRRLSIILHPLLLVSSFLRCTNLRPADGLYSHKAVNIMSLTRPGPTVQVGTLCVRIVDRSNVKRLVLSFGIFVDIIAYAAFSIVRMQAVVLSTQGTHGSTCCVLVRAFRSVASITAVFSWRIVDDM